MTTSGTVSLFQSQQASLSNANQTICQPINWSLILAKTVPKWTPRTVRSYLVNVCEKLNAHFAVLMSGPKIGNIECTRLNRDPTQPPIKVILSFWRCQQLFPKKISLKWVENDSIRQIHMSCFQMWMKSGNRREIQPAVKAPNQPPDIAVQWLRQMLALSHTDACPIEFNKSNVRQHVYESWLELIPENRRVDWTPKRISASIYRLFPGSRPYKGYRQRLRGVAVINIPSIETCIDALEQTKYVPLRL